MTANGVDVSIHEIAKMPPGDAMHQSGRGEERNDGGYRDFPLFGPVREALFRMRMHDRID